MLLRHFAGLLVASLLTILAVQPAFAAPPTIIDVKEKFEDVGLTQACGFPVEVSVTGQLIVRSRDGTEDTTGANYQVTFTNVESGKSFTLRTSGLQRISSTDTSSTFSFFGGDKIVVPGMGAVFINVGKFVQTVTFDPQTGEVIDVEIVREGRDAELSAQLICSLLAP